MEDAKNVGAAVGLVLTLLWGLALLLLRERFQRIATGVERIPPPEWFTKVDREVERIPDQAYFDDIRRHMAQSEEQLRRLAILEYRAEEAGRRAEKDHERIGKLEAEVSFNRERLNSLDRRQDRRAEGA